MALRLPIECTPLFGNCENLRTGRWQFGVAKRRPHSIPDRSVLHILNVGSLDTVVECVKISLNVIGAWPEREEPVSMLTLVDKRTRKIAAIRGM